MGDVVVGVVVVVVVVIVVFASVTGGGGAVFVNFLFEFMLVFGSWPLPRLKSL